MLLILFELVSLSFLPVQCFGCVLHLSLGIFILECWQILFGEVHHFSHVKSQMWYWGGGMCTCLKSRICQHSRTRYLRKVGWYTPKTLCRIGIGGEMRKLVHTKFSFRFLYQGSPLFNLCSVHVEKVYIKYFRLKTSCNCHVWLKNEYHFYKRH